MRWGNPDERWMGPRSTAAAAATGVWTDSSSPVLLEVDGRAVERSRETSFGALDFRSRVVFIVMVMVVAW